MWLNHQCPPGPIFCTPHSVYGIKRRREKNELFCFVFLFFCDTKALLLKKTTLLLFIKSRFLLEEASRIRHESVWEKSASAVFHRIIEAKKKKRKKKTKNRSARRNKRNTNTNNNNLKFLKKKRVVFVSSLKIEALLVFAFRESLYSIGVCPHKKYLLFVRVCVCVCVCVFKSFPPQKTTKGILLSVLFVLVLVTRRRTEDIIIIIDDDDGAKIIVQQQRKKIGEDDEAKKAGEKTRRRRTFAAFALLFSRDQSRCLRRRDVLVVSYQQCPFWKRHH